jgi:transporter family-2 protein
MPNLLAAGLAFLAGIALALQVVINAGLSRTVGHPILAAFISVCVSAACFMLAVLVLRLPLPTRAALGGVAPWAWAGGALGAVYLTLSIFAVPRLGAAEVLAVIISGQLMAALVLDHLGAFGLAQHGITPLRVVGAAALVVGVVFIRFF